MSAPFSQRDDALFISEIFRTVQGEGPSTGVVATFLRLAHCNLRCTWCDTPFTWDWKRHDVRTEVREETVANVGARVRDLGPGTLVVTGGEPMLQQSAIAALLPTVDMRVEVETAGTVLPEPALRSLVAQWNVSLKLASSGNPEARRLRPEAIRYFADASNAFFKFVVSLEADLVEIRALCGHFGIPHERVSLMPEGATRERYLANAPQTVQWCIDEGYRFCPRVHVAIWGDKRGV